MAAALPASTRRPAMLRTLTDEGFRLFFPLAALHLAAWPLLWTLVHGLALPLARTMPASAWHAHEMLFGGFGAALVGFLTTAVPEWTDTQGPSRRALAAMALAWGLARLIGLLGFDALAWLALAADLAWLAALLGYLLVVSTRRRTTALLAFAGWIAALALAQVGVRAAFARGDAALASQALHVTMLVYIGLLGLALARITVAVTNLTLDPSGRSAPFRPHPGRRNLAPALVALVIAGELAGVSEAVSGFLWLAAGAAFVDRVAEAFVGRAALRAQLVALAGASLLTGVGLAAVGAARLGVPIAPAVGVHVATMGGLGLGVLAVLAIVGRLHTGRTLVLSSITCVALALLVAATGLRVAPALGWGVPPGPPYAVASLLWAAAFGLWLAEHVRVLADADTVGARHC